MVPSQLSNILREGHAPYYILQCNRVYNSILNDQ